MKSNSVFFGIFGTIAMLLAVIGMNSIIPTAAGINKEDEVDITSRVETFAPKKIDLIGTYKVKNDKTSKLELFDDGRYSLIINVCEGYAVLEGNYEIRDTNIKLFNNEYAYEDLYGNEELTFTIVDENTLKSDESLVCTTQETLFEK